jgi:hypothetical protein
MKFKPNFDGSYYFASIGFGMGQTTCFIDSKTDEVTFDGNPRNEPELYGEAQKFIKEKKK